MWTEEWKYEKERWYLDPETERFKKYMGECYP